MDGWCDEIKDQLGMAVSRPIREPKHTTLDFAGLPPSRACLIFVGYDLVHTYYIPTSRGF